MSAIDDILRKRGREPSREREATGDYRGFTDSDGHPQMGFSLNRANGAIDAFFYHNLDNLDLRIIRGTEYLNFTHRGKAVTLQGTHLKPMLMAMMQHMLTDIHEYSGDGSDLSDAATVITRVAVTTVSLNQESAAAMASDMAEGMHPH